MAQDATWKLAGDKIRTPWADKVDPANPLPDYPRPILERSQWQSLNGLWQYAILEKGMAEPTQWQGNILVPFCIESPLSGVMDTVTENEELWYKRQFSVPASWKGKRIMLNFGAVDWQADVYVNDIHVGTHRGGYSGFSIDITPYLNAKGSQKLVVRVWDPTDKGYQPIGKQTLKPRSIWYTAVTGIWQTVWIEPVGDCYLTSVNSQCDLKHGTVELTINSDGNNQGCIVQVDLYDGSDLVSSAKGMANGTLRLCVKDVKCWSPEHPFLYGLKLKLTRNGKLVDQADSYLAMRTISATRDWDGGVMRLQLNDSNYFQYGPLDQGWFPDGLYTAPTDEAMVYDLEMTKKLGFNMIRKHVKVEPDRWYYHCDRLGILVWQDMPSGDYGNQWEPYKYNGGTDRQRTPESRSNYFAEWKGIMQLCMPHPCVVVWVPFNEAWGQFATEEVVAWTHDMDPSRLINPASGGNHRDCGDIFDFHHYPHPAMFLSDPNRVNVLGEYGGIGLALEGHLWFPDRNWGYVQFKSKEDVTREYVRYADMLKQYVEKGFSAAVYTQTTDCEGEVNGLMTYDRRELKVDPESVRAANLEVRALVK